MPLKLTSNKPVYRGQVPVGESIYLQPGRPLRIGRGKEAEYQIADGRISRVHCVIQFKSGKPTIEDLDSVNGTFVNGKRVKAAVLQEGDEVGVGDVLLRLETYEESAGVVAKSEPQPPPPTAKQSAHPTKVAPTVRPCESCGEPIKLAGSTSAYCSKCNDPLLGQTIGAFRIVRPVGTGQTSLVYRAESAESKETVALKVLKPDIARDPAAVERFRKAASIGERFDHPNHVRVRAVGEFEGRPYAAADLASGETAEALAAGPKRIDIDRAAAIGLQVAAALAVAEREGTCHGDLSPARVLVGSTGEARVLGFGGCEWSAEAASRDGAALGRLVCHLIAGKLPLAATEVPQLLSAHPQGLVDAISRLMKGADGSPIEAILDLLPFAIRKKGRVGLPASIRSLEMLDLIAPKGSEARIAALLRGRLLPAQFAAPEGWSIVAHSRPTGVYPRDCVQVVAQPTGGCALIVATGLQYGFSGAVLLGMLSSAFHALGLLMQRPAGLLDKCGDRVRGEAKDAVQVQATGVIIDPAKDELHACMAGAQAIFAWSRAKEQLTAIRGEAPALGAPGASQGQNQTVKVEPGDRVLVPCEGLLGAKNAKGTAFGVERTLQVLRAAGRTFPEQAEALFKAVSEHRGPTTIGGDLTLVAIERAVAV